MEAQDEPEACEAPTPRMLSWARNSAIYRLERRMLTEKELSDAIARKAREKFEAIGEAQVRALAEFAVAFAYQNSALDDNAYAAASTRSAVRSGKSRRTIAQRLSRKGIARDTLETALGEADDLLAALNLARKRAFGPFRKVELDEKRKAKELSAFARAGFSFEIGKRVFAMSREEAEEVLPSSHQL